MIIKYSPQVNDNKINYVFETEKIIAELNGVTDIFDFINLPDGELLEIETTLEIQPIIDGYKKDGILHLTLLNFISNRATDEEKYPSEFEV